jgi:hypothetical protein
MFMNLTTVLLTGACLIYFGWAPTVSSLGILLRAYLLSFPALCGFGNEFWVILVIIFFYCQQLESIWNRYDPYVLYFDRRFIVLRFLIKFMVLLRFSSLTENGLIVNVDGQVLHGNGLGNHVDLVQPDFLRRFSQTLAGTLVSRIFKIVAFIFFFVLFVFLSPVLIITHVFMLLHSPGGQNRKFLRAFVRLMAFFIGVSAAVYLFYYKDLQVAVDYLNEGRKIGSEMFLELVETIVVFGRVVSFWLGNLA